MLRYFFLIAGLSFLPALHGCTDGVDQVPLPGQPPGDTSP